MNADIYEIAYEEICRRSRCKNDERLCIEQTTYDIIKCKQDDKWVAYMHNLDGSIIIDYTINKVKCGFDATIKNNSVKMIIVETLLKYAKVGNVMISEKIFINNMVSLDDYVVINRNETLESLLISYDLSVKEKTELFV